MFRVYNVAVENEANRGQCAAAGGGKALLPLANEGTQKGMRFAAQALARMAITQDPTLAFPGQRVCKYYLYLNYICFEGFIQVFASGWG